MLGYINKYRNLSFEDKTTFNTRFSIIFNAILAIAKMLLSIYFGIFFLVAGIVNIFIMISKLECFVGIKHPNKSSFNHRNKMISLFLMLAGLQYAIYMSRLILTDVSVFKFNMVISIIIALVSFVELAIAIKGIFNSLGKGHYFRNIKIINLCSALTAIVLTEVALTTSLGEFDSRIINGIVGLSVGAIIMLLALFIVIAPRFSIMDRLHSIYKAAGDEFIINDDELRIELTHSKFYTNYTYIAKKNKDLLDGWIIRSKLPIWSWNKFLLVIVFILSEILVFPYAIGALISYFCHKKVLDKLDFELNGLGYMKTSEGEE